MWFPAITAACTALAGALLSRRQFGGGHLTVALLPRNHQPAVFGLFYVMATLDYGMHLNDDLHQHCMSGIDYLDVLVHPATLRGQQQNIQNTCTAPSTSILADSVVKVECQEDGNCGFYSTLNGMNLNANKV